MLKQGGLELMSDSMAICMAVCSIQCVLCIYVIHAVVCTPHTVYTVHYTQCTQCTQCTHLKQTRNRSNCDPAGYHDKKIRLTDWYINWVLVLHLQGIIPGKNKASVISDKT